MYFVNRSVVIVKAKQPFVDWINSTNAPGDPTIATIENVNNEPNVYLVPEYENDNELKRILPSVIDCIWEEELMSWYIDEATWPKDRSKKKFMEWFELQVASSVMDIAGDPLDREES